MVIQSIFFYSLLIFLMLIGFLFSTNKSTTSIYHNGLYTESNFYQFKIIFPILIFSVFFGMRYNVGYDYLTYLNVYVNKYEGGSFEILFNFINQIGHFFNMHFAVYFSILAFLQIFFYFYAFKKDTYLIPFLSFYLITDAFFLYWMNGIRQGIAMTIWVFSLHFIVEKKPWKYIITVVAASLFHASAIVFLVFYPLFINSKFSIKKTYIQVLLFSFTILLREYLYSFLIGLENVFIFFISISSSKYLYYLESFNEEASFETTNILSFIWRSLLMLLMILFGSKMKRFYNNRLFNLIYVLFFYSVLLINIIPFDSILHRVSVYFEVFRPIMLSYFSYYLLKNGKLSSKLLFLFVIIGYIGLFIVRQLVADEESRTLFQFYFLQ